MSQSVIGALRVTLGIDTAAFEDGLKAAQKQVAAAGTRLQQAGESMASVGKTLSVAVTAPLVAFGVSAVKAANESADALAQVNAALASMGPVAGRSSEQLQQAAAELQRLSTFDDDDILRNVTANLLTFGNISGEVFDRAQLAIVNFATRSKRDLQSATLIVAKALNDPVKGLTALGKAGVKLSEDQTRLIKSLVETGDVAGAQAIILNELETKYRGAARAARDAAPGSDMIDAWREFQETIGAIIAKALPPLTDMLARVLGAFNSLSPGTQAFVVGMGAVAAAVGPLLVISGTLVSSVGSLVTAFAPAIAAAGGLGGALAALGGALAPLLAPLAAVAAAGALIYLNWDKIAPVLEALKARFVEVIGPKIQALIETVKARLTELWNGPLGEAIRTVIDWIGRLGAAFLEWLGERIIAIASAFVSAIEAGFKIVTDVLNIVIGVLTGDFARAWQGLKSLVGDVIDGIVGIVKSLFPETARVLGALAEGFAQWFSNLAGRMIEWGRAIIDGLVKGIEAAREAVWNALREVVLRGVENVRKLLGIASPSRLFMTFGAAVSEGLALGITGGLPKVEAAMDRLGQSVAKGLAELPAGRGIALDFSPTIGEGIEAASDDLRSTFSQTFADGIRAALKGDLKGFLQRLFDSILDNAVRNAADALAQVVSGLLGNLGRGGGLAGVFAQVFSGLFGRAPGFALGGSFTVGGRPGRDANLIAFRATRGEHVRISRSEAEGANIIAPASAPVVNITQNIDATGADPAAIARLNSKLEQMNAQLPALIVRTVQDASNRRIITLGARG
jgi:phage-related minor tail protein